MSVDSIPPAEGSAGRRSLGRAVVRVRAGVMLLLCVAMAGCSVLDKPVRPAVYDFGPGVLSPPASVAGHALPVLTLGEVEVASALDSTAILYRLGYVNPQQLLPYALARWSMTPAQLLRQRLRDHLGQRHTVLGAGDGHLAGNQPVPVLRIDLDEFSQLFSAPAQSAGLVRLRATLVLSTTSGDRVLGQHTVVAQRPASSGDAPGGVRALAQAADAAVQELAQWLNQLR